MESQSLIQDLMDFFVWEIVNERENEFEAIKTAGIYSTDYIFLVEYIHTLHQSDSLNTFCSLSLVTDDFFK